MRPRRSVSVVGAGLMGQSIAIANAQGNRRVTIADTLPEVLARAVSKIHSAVGNPLLVKPTTSVAELGDCDLLIEAIVENSASKRKLFQRLEPHLADSALVASNTSSIAITNLAAGLNKPERFCGLHFCHPVAKRALVEVVRGERTSEETIVIAAQYVRGLGKIPIVVQDSPGFLLNRILVPYLNEALVLLADGVCVEAIEQAATGFGMEMGPFRQMDEFGIDTGLRIGAFLRKAFPDRVPAPEVLITLYQQGRLGQKSGAGFYRYPPDGTPVLDPEVADLIQQPRRSTLHLQPDQIMIRLLLPMLVEATRILAEQSALRPGDVDLATVHGLAFPKDGLLQWANTKGMDAILELLRAHASLGKRFEPTPLLCEMAKTKRRFGD